MSQCGSTWGEAESGREWPSDTLHLKYAYLKKHASKTLKPLNAQVAFLRFSPF
jgi:hypothetical protein